jgi:hypothetical protein
MKNSFFQILVNIPKILYTKNEEDPVENKKKWVGAMFWKNWVNEKMVKFRSLSRSDKIMYLMYAEQSSFHL